MFMWWWLHHMIWLVGSPCSIGVVPFLLDQVPIVGWLNQLDPHIGCPFFIILVDQVPIFVPQQRELMGSSAQNSSGVHWCRRRVRFNRVPEKVEKVWEALVQSPVEPDLALHQSLPDLLRTGPGCTKASQTFSGTFSGTFLKLTWLCTKASRNLLRKLPRNPSEPYWTWPGSAPQSLPESSPQPSSEPPGSGEGSGEGLGGGSEEGCGEDSGRLCGAEPGQVQ